MDLGERVAAHSALADPHRLGIVDALAIGDRTPQELAALVEVPSNLLAHHLKVLEDAGLVRRRASEGDRRRRYVVLLPERLRGLVPVPAMPEGMVLFVCTHNSARSPFAAALWRLHTGRPAESAGAEPGPRLHPAAVRAARRMGIDLTGETPRGYDGVRTRPALIVSVCDRAREADVPFDAPALHWSVPDPVSDGRQAAFTSAFADISRRIERLAAARP